MANRMGQLGPRQRQRLERSGYWNLFGSVVIAGILLAILLFVAERPLKAIQVSLVVGLMVASLGLGVVMLLRSRAAAAAGDVEILVGPVRTYLRRQAGWYLTIGERTLKLPVQFWHIENGPSYRVYVAGKASRIVAMEPDDWS